MRDKIQVITRPRKEVENLAQHLQLDFEDGVLDMGGVKLVLNGKQDAYYTVTKNACSCPDFLFRQAVKGEFCKHQKLLYQKVLFPEPREDARLAAAHSLRDSINESQGELIARPRAKGVA